MAFRNPTHSLPADRITGQIQGSQLAADAIDGKVITGATVQTSADGARVVVGPDDAVRFYSGSARETSPGLITTTVQPDPNDPSVQTSSLIIIGPQIDAIAPLHVEVTTGTDGSQNAVLGGLQVSTYADGTHHATLTGELTIVGAGAADQGLHLQGGGVTTTDTPTVLSLTTGYTAHTGYDPPTVERMPDGWVRMWGRVDTPGTWSSGVTIATVPTALRPVKPWIFTGKAVAAGAGAAVSVETSGAVRLWNPSGSPTDITLTEIAWQLAT